MCAVWESTGREGYSEVKRGAKSCVGNRMSIVICCVLVRSHTQGEAFFLFKHFCYLTSELRELLKVVNTLILFHYAPSQASPTSVVCQWRWALFGTGPGDSK